MKNDFNGDFSRNDKMSKSPYAYSFNFEILLTFDSVMRLYKTAGSAGITPEQLLAEFVDCLTSDPEEIDDSSVEKANDWYKSCWWCGDEEEYFSFLQYILKRGLYDDVIYSIGRVEHYTALLGFMKEPEFSKNVENEYSGICEAIESLHNKLTDTFLEYCKKNKTHKSYTEEIQEIIDFDRKLVQLTRQRPLNLFSN